MRVSFESKHYLYLGDDEEGLPKFRKYDEKTVEGTVVGTVVMDIQDIIGEKKYQKPVFIIALDDGTFTYIDVKYCKRVGDI